MGSTVSKTPAAPNVIANGVVDISSPTSFPPMLPFMQIRLMGVNCLGKDSLYDAWTGHGLPADASSIRNDVTQDWTQKYESDIVMANFHQVDATQPGQTMKLRVLNSNPEYGSSTRDDSHWRSNVFVICVPPTLPLGETEESLLIGMLADITSRPDSDRTGGPTIVVVLVLDTASEYKPQATAQLLSQLSSMRGNTLVLHCNLLNPRHVFGCLHAICRQWWQWKDDALLGTETDDAFARTLLKYNQCMS